MVLSRHRLPHLYRFSLTGLWLLPIGLLLVAIVLGTGLSPVLFDPRLLFFFGLMAVPALYVWREGVDVLADGITVRVHWPHFRAYNSLDNWYYDTRTNRRVLTVWGCDGRKVLECRGGHLTHLPALLLALKTQIRYRNWPI